MARWRRQVGILLTALAVTGCGDTAPSTTPTAPTPTPKTNRANEIVQRACQGTPAPIAARIAEAKPYHRPDDKQGPTCMWYREGDLSRRALMVAVDAPGYSGWIELLPKPTSEITVAGTAGVTSGDPSHCTLVVDLGGHALNVELIGLNDTDCAQTRTITEQALASQS